jgi:predicted RNA-binding protein
LIFTYDLENAVWNVKEYHVGLEVNVSHQLLVYAEQKYKNAVKNRTAVASYEVGLEINTEKTKNMVMSRHQSVG